MGEQLASDPTTSPTMSGGNFSYGIMPAVGNRRPKWSNTFSAVEAAIGNRGCSFILQPNNATTGVWTVDPTTNTPSTFNGPVGINSNTLLIHGARTTWEGNIGYNDNHVNFETRADPEGTPFTFNNLPAGQKSQTDNLFVNESDQTRLPMAENLSTTGSPAPGQNTNNFLRVWYTATHNNQVISQISPWFD